MIVLQNIHISSLLKNVIDFTVCNIVNVSNIKKENASLPL